MNAVNGTIPVSFFAFDTIHLFQSDLALQETDSNNPIIVSKIISATIESQAKVEGLPNEREVVITFRLLNVSASIHVYLGQLLAYLNIEINISIFILDIKVLRS